jgi:hypothetical protein
MSDKPSGGVGIRVTLRRGAALLRSVRGNLKYLLLLIGVPIAVVLIYSIPLGQSHVVEARTLGARLTILGPDTVWRLPPSTLCVDRGTDRDLVLASDFDGPGCNPGIFAEQDLGNVELRIPSGVQILVRAEPDGTVLLRRLEDQTSNNSIAVRLVNDTFWETGSLIRIDADAWRKVALLEFAGNAVIGQAAVAGSTDYLIEGRYEVREHFLRQYRPFGTSQTEPTTVKSGTLYRGDRVSFVPTASDLDDLPVVVTGFISPQLLQNTLGFGIVISSGFDQSQAKMRVKSFGAREITIAPSWVDRAVRDPLLVALTAILGFAVTSLSFASEVRKIGHKGRR